MILMFGETLRLPRRFQCLAQERSQKALLIVLLGVHKTMALPT